ncbi:hypothetical protein LTR53_012610 [Teratosphaeriaceae sp. CCFEE 6253]|nr:hypothetical protein LTR53_012610 [Teratosphaeriaceae sp. CCFEE 6253]
MRTTTFLAGILPVLAISIPVAPRAGGPAFIPIPANCTVINPLPYAGGSTANVGCVNGFKPAANFTASHHIYGYYLASTPNNQSTQFEMCLEQCNGFSYKGDCKSALLAYRVPYPKFYYGVTPDGELAGVGCLMFDAYLDPNKFVAAPVGQYVNETAGSIYCPS